MARENIRSAPELQLSQTERELCYVSVVLN